MKMTLAEFCWTATVGFTYLSDGSGGLEAALEGMGIHERQPVRTDEVEAEDGRISRHVSTEVALEGDELDDAFATSLSNVLAGFIKNMTPVVNEHRFRYRAPDANVYEMLVLTGSAESVEGRLIWSRSEGTWSYETSDPLISHALERVMAQGHADIWKSWSTEYEDADGFVPVRPTDTRFVRALVDDLQHCGAGFRRFREASDPKTEAIINDTPRD